MRDSNLLDDKEKRFEHWWPVSLQEFWVGDDKRIGKVPPGQVARKKPSNRAFGGARRAHFVELNGPWTHSYEGAFEKSDNDAPRLVGEVLPLIQRVPYRFIPILRSVISSKIRTDALTYRFNQIDLESRIRYGLLRTALSVVVRSPGYRYKASFGRACFGPEFSPNLGRMRIYFDWANLSNVVPVGAPDMSIVFLRAPPSKEFILGDSFIEDCVQDLKSRIGGRTSTVGSSRTLLLFPLSPEISAMFVFGCKHPLTVVVDTIHQEIDEINETVQRLSVKELYYRKHKPLPPIIPACGEKREIEISQTSFVARMVASVASADTNPRPAVAFP